MNTWFGIIFCFFSMLFSIRWLMEFIGEEDAVEIRQSPYYASKTPSHLKGYLALTFFVATWITFVRIPYMWWMIVALMIFAGWRYLVLRRGRFIEETWKTRAVTYFCLGFITLTSAALFLDRYFQKEYVYGVLFGLSFLSLLFVVGGTYFADHGRIHGDELRSDMAKKAFVIVGLFLASAIGYMYLSV